MAAVADLACAAPIAADGRQQRTVSTVATVAIERATGGAIATARGASEAVTDHHRRPLESRREVTLTSRAVAASGTGSASNAVRTSQRRRPGRTAPAGCSCRATRTTHTRRATCAACATGSAKATLTCSTADGLEITIATIATGTTRHTVRAVATGATTTRRTTGATEPAVQTASATCATVAAATASRAGHTGRSTAAVPTAPADALSDIRTHIGAQAAVHGEAAITAVTARRCDTAVAARATSAAGGNTRVHGSATTIAARTAARPGSTRCARSGPRPHEGVGTVGAIRERSHQQ